MRKIIKARYAIFAIWLIATIVLTVLSPNINTVLENKGQSVLPDSSSSVIANNILTKMKKVTGSDAILVFYDKKKISDNEMDQIKNGVKVIADNKSQLGISDIIDPFSMAAAKSSLISKDGTLLMVSFKLDKKSRSIDTINKLFDSKLKNVQAEHYLTGGDFINSDYQKKSEAGVSQSAALTVLFILVILIIMFRSVVTPLISLLAVVFSYLCSMGIASQLIVHAGFPVTSVTQMLMILILFGVGTDYNILLFNRFKEELSHGCSIDDAIVKTYKTAGKTIAFSIVTVFIAFFSLITAESAIYRSGAVVAIAVAVLLLEILTLTPFIMKLLGKKLFWPSKSVTGHKESKLWGKVSTVSTKHPIISFVVIALLITSTVVTYQNKLNFDTLKELGNSCTSAKAINLVTDKFGKGQAMPSTVVIQSNKALTNNESLAVIDNITERIKKIKGVKKVSSATQPEGKQISSFYISSSMKSVTNGISRTQNGVDQIYTGLNLASNKLGSADFSKVNNMVDGTAQLQTGVSALANGLTQIQTGLTGGANSSQNISSGLSSIETNLSKMSSGVSLLAGSYSKMQSGYAQMGAGYQGAAQALLGVKSTISNMQLTIASLGNSYPELKSDSNYITLSQTVDGLISSLSRITPKSIQTLNANYNAVTSGFAQANSSLKRIANGLSQMANGMEQLKTGLGKASDGISTIVTNMNKVSDGLGQMKSGQQKLVTGLNGFSKFGKSLTAVAGGLKQISGGLGKTNNFLSELNSNKTFFMPNEALTNESINQVFDNYMSSNRKTTKITVVLNDDPYSNNAMETVKQINETVASGLKGTTLSNAKYGTAGTTATSSDTNDVLTRDLVRTTIIVLIAVLIVLILIMRSIWAPICITASLMGAYYVAMFAINTIFLNLQRLAGISSFVPFFSFLIIVALGVDYSIFLMMRYKEYPQMSPKDAIILASKKTGGIVMSACVILGGTFATLLPSGIVLLCEWATAVMSGLAVLCFVLLPIFLPAAIALPDILKKLFSKKENSFSEDKKAA